MTPPLIIIIPSHDRDGLLKRTLTSLAECELPAELRQVIVAENGARLGAEAMVSSFSSRLPLTYRYTEAGNKSRALNAAMADLTDEFVIFYDDDVRLAQGNLLAYARLVQDRKGGVFLGGRCLPEYEEPPPDWLRSYLPPSVNGWSLGDSVCPLVLPDALGMNWAAFASEIKALGGFNESRGPGTKSRGQERDMLVRLLAGGVAGYYVPDASVLHWVPRSRCSPDWMLRRAEQMGAYQGMEYQRRPWPRRLYTRLALRFFRLPRFRLQLRRLPVNTPPETRFASEYKLRWYQGVLVGMETP